MRSHPGTIVHSETETPRRSHAASAFATALALALVSVLMFVVGSVAG